MIFTKFLRVEKRMVSRSAITKMKAILIIDVIVVAIAAGTYIYLQNQGILTYGSKPAEFTVTDLTINPLEAEAGEPVFISVNVTNVGEETGNYSANLTINDALKGNQTITLIGGTSTTVEFTDIENSEGNYTVKIDGLSGWFLIKPAPPTTSNISLSDLLISPYEAWVGDPISIKVTVSNPSGAADSLSVKLRINDTTIETKKVELAAGQKTTVEFNVTESSEGTYSVIIGSLARKFKIVPTGKHTLVISTIAPIKFTINGESQTTPYRELLDVGTYNINMPATDPTGKYTFEKWEDGSTNPTRTISLQSYTIIVAYYTGGTSCPSLYVWNGTSYVYVSEVSNHGWLGYINYINEDGSIIFYKNNPWDYIPLNSSQMQPTNGNYNLTLIQRWNEIFYLDQAYMVVVDHPANVDVYSTMVEQYLDPNYMGKIYTVSKNPLTPISAVNEKGENVLPQISKMDGIFTPGINGINSPSWDNITWNRLTLNLGNLTDAKQIKLVVRAIVDWGSG